MTTSFCVIALSRQVGRCGFEPLTPRAWAIIESDIVVKGAYSRRVEKIIKRNSARDFHCARRAPRIDLLLMCLPTQMFGIIISFEVK